MILLTGGRQKLLGTREGETTTTITIEQTAIQRHTVVYTAVERGGLDARVCYSCRCACLENSSSKRSRCFLDDISYCQYCNVRAWPIQTTRVLRGVTRYIKSKTTRMWPNAQRDGRHAEYRWRPVFSAAKFG